MPRPSNLIAAAGLGGALLTGAPTVADEATLFRHEFRVTTADGVGIRVREVRPEQVAAGEPLILIHGARVPGIASFDLDVPGGSLAGDLARALRRPVYVMDARGYGGSDRAAAMERAAGESRPLSRAHQVVRDIDAVAQATAARGGTQRVALFGWATGGMWAAFYASLWPDRVGHVVSLNALYGGAAEHPTLGPGSTNADPKEPTRFSPKVGGYALYDAASLFPVSDRTIPLADKTLWRDPRIAEAYARTALASDPRSAEHEPRKFRAPLGAIEDSFYQAGGRRLFDAGSITARVLVIRAGRDFWSRPADAEAFARDAARAAEVRVVTLPDATHFVHLDRPERGRDEMLREVVGFLTRPSEATRATEKRLTRPARRAGRDMSA